jgi:hypothetical protein
VIYNFLIKTFFLALKLSLMLSRILFLSLTLIFFFFILACSKKDDTDTNTAKTNAEYISAADCMGVSPKYTTDIKAIFDAKCASAGCHGGSAPAHGLSLATYDLAKRDFNVHALLCSINQDANCSKMPRGGAKLSADEIKKITCWAKNGFVN